MPIIPEEPLHKITFNAFSSDVVWFENTYGYGWTTKLREIMRAHRKKAAMTFIEQLEEQSERGS